jgi:hypothetical protein
MPNTQAPTLQPGKQHTLQLLPHPGCTAVPEGQVTVSLKLSDCTLDIQYVIAVNTLKIRLPEPGAKRTAGQRRDGLWQHTCCEAFIATENQTGYLEFNFSPSGDWACYAFNDYRQPAPLPRLATSPRITCQATDDGFCLQAAVDRESLPIARPWHLGLSCVLKECSGHKTYWALQHDTPQPDFHRRACFTLSLP